MPLSRALVCLGFALLVGCQPAEKVLPAHNALARAQLRFPVSGTFDAHVKMNSGTFKVPVQVDADKVRCIKWSNEPCLNVFNAQLEDGKADGVAANGELVRIEIPSLG